MEGFGHLGHGAPPYSWQSNLPSIAPSTVRPPFYSSMPNPMGHLPQPHYSDPHNAFTVRPPQDNSLHTNPPTSSRYFFPSPISGPSPSPGPNLNHPVGIPPSVAYAQSMTTSDFLISRHYQPQYPSALIQPLDVSEHGKVLSTSGFTPTIPVRSLSNRLNGGGDHLKQKDVNVGTPPSYATPVNQDYSIGSIQEKLRGIEPLDESNYTKWRSQIDITLGHLEYNMALLESKPALPADTAPEFVKEKYQKWSKANRMCIMIIRGSLCETIRDRIPDTDSAKELMDYIHTQSIRSRRGLIAGTISQLCVMKFDGQGVVRDHIVEMEKLVGRLKDLNMEINDDFVVHMVLNSLHEGFDSVKDKYYSTEQKWDVNEVVGHCVEEEGRRRKEKKNHGCYTCGTQGHVANNCPNKSETTEVRDTGKRDRDGSCYRCGQFGHKVPACPMPDINKRSRQESKQLVKRYWAAGAK